MERISRALELARAQRESRFVSEPIARATPASEAEPAKIDHRASQSEAGDKFGDTRAFRLPVAQLSPQQRDNERILAPGSSGIAAAPYKMLRTQVLKRLDQLNANTIAVISPDALAGKTLTAINLAISIAADPERSAILVDFDLRNPSIHKRLGYAPTVGLEECLRSGRPLSDAMFKVSGYDKLTVLAARERIDESSELLRSHRTEQAVLEMRKRYANRVVIFDLPPALLADDALVGSSRVDLQACKLEYSIVSPK